MTDEALLWLQGLPPWAVHGFLIFSAVVENVFPPWPGDTFVVFGGMLSAQGVIRFPTAVVTTLIGNLIGAWIMYYAGEHLLTFVRGLHARMRNGYMRRLLASVTSEDGMQRTEKWFRKWGAAFVLVSRFSAGIRFFVSILAGISRMNPVLFSITFGLGVIAWNVLLLSGGLLLSNNWRKVLAWLEIYNVFAALIVGTVALLFILRFYRRRSAASRGRSRR